MSQLNPADLVPYREALFKRFAKCLDSCHVQVTERILFLWSGNAFSNAVIRDKENVQVLLKVVYPSLRRCEMNATNESVKQIVMHVIGIFMDADMELTQQLADQFDNAK